MATRNVVPRAHNEGSIGTPVKMWASAYLNTLYTPNFGIDGLVFSPLVDNTNALGQQSLRFSDVYAVNLHGTATGAQYQDLAEKYTCADKDIPVGSVMCVSTKKGIETEVCNHINCACVMGVYSVKPGFIMGEQINGPTVGLVGKIPVRIVGPIKKSQAIVSCGGGCAKAAITPDEIANKIGHSFEENLEDEEKLVMCFIK
jgi:hypothetical protein